MISSLVFFVSLLFSAVVYADTIYSGVTYGTTLLENAQVAGFEYTNFTGSITQQNHLWPVPPEITDDTSWQWCREVFNGSYLQLGTNQSYIFSDETNNTYKSFSRNYNKYDFYVVGGGCTNIYPYDYTKPYPYVYYDHEEISDGPSTPTIQGADAWVLGAGRLPYKMVKYEFYDPLGCAWQYDVACSSYFKGSFYQKGGYFEFIPQSVAANADITVDIVINSSVYIPLSTVFYHDSFLIKVENEGSVSYHPFTSYVSDGFYQYPSNTQSLAVGVYTGQLKFNYKGDKVRITIATAPGTHYSLSGTAVFAGHIDSLKVKPMSAFPVWDKPPYVARQSVLDMLHDEFSTAFTDFLTNMKSRLHNADDVNVSSGDSVVTWMYNNEEHTFDFAEYSGFFSVINTVVYLVAGGYSIKLLTKSWGV